MEKANIPRYQELQNFKAAWKGDIRDCYENIKAYISIFQNNSYAVIEPTIHRSYKSITPLNDINVSEMLSFRYASNITTANNSISNSNGSLIF